MQLSNQAIVLGGGGGGLIGGGSSISAVVANPMSIFSPSKHGHAGIKELTLTERVIERREVKTRCPVQMKLLIDKSGSMSGAKWNECMAAIREIITSEVKDTDYVGMSTFAGSILDRFSKTCKNGHTKDYVSIKEIGLLTSWVDSVARVGANGGSTALYASMVEEAGRFKTYGAIPDLQHILVVVTDGEDSKIRGHPTPDKVNELLHQIEESDENLNLRIIILPIGLSDENEATMDKMLHGAPTSKAFPKGRPRLGSVHSVKSASVLKDIFKTQIKGVMTTKKESFRVAHDRHGNATILMSTTAAAPNFSPQTHNGGGSGQHKPQKR